MDLVRYREAKEIDRLPLTPLFDEQFADAGIVAIIQRWATQDDDFTASLRDGFPQSVAKRKTVQVMHFADYDHDGSATEFLLQIGTAPCGKQVCVAVGLSKTKPSLHAFGTAMAPDKPLYLQRRIWEQFRKSNGEIRAESWTCGDHGSEISTSVLLRATPQGIDGKWREYSCPPERRRLIKETPLSAPLY